MQLNKASTYWCIVLVAILSLSMFFLPSYVVREAENPEVQAYVVPINRELQRSFLGGIKLVNRLIRAGLKVYWLTQSIKIRFTNESTYSLERGSFLIQARQSTAVYGLISKFFSSYLRKISEELNASCFEVHYPFEAVAYSLTDFKVAVYGGSGVTGGAIEHVTPLAAADFNVNIISETDIQQGKLEGYDVLTFPGGSYDLNDTIIQKIKDFVKLGGGFLGTCGGAVFGAQNDLLNVRFATVNQSLAYASLRGPIVLKLKAEIHPISFGYEEPFKSTYFLGPIIDWVGNDVEVVATCYLPTTDLRIYAPEFARPYLRTDQETVNRLWDTPAIVTGQYGNGKVVLSTVHPENLPESQPLFIDSIYYLLRPEPMKFKTDSFHERTITTSIGQEALTSWNQTSILQTITWLRTFQNHSLNARKALNGYEIANRETIGLSGEYLELYLSNIQSCSAELLNASLNLESTYANLEKWKDVLAVRMPKLRAFSGLNGNSIVQIENLQSQVTSIFRSIAKTEMLIDTVDLANKALLEEMNVLQQISSANQESGHYEKIVELEQMESLTLWKLKEGVYYHLLQWLFRIQSVLFEADFIISLCNFFD